MRYWTQIGEISPVLVSIIGNTCYDVYIVNLKKGKRKVQGVPQSQTAAPPRHQEEEETDKSKQAQIDQNAKRTEKHKNKMAQGKTSNKLPRRINHKAPKSKTNTGTTALERSVE